MVITAPVNSDVRWLIVECTSIQIEEDEDEHLALEITNDLDDLKLKKKIEKMLVTAKAHEPRPFFWTSAA